MTVVIRDGYAWIAERDRVAHAHVARGRVTRTVCGLPALDVRMAHPAAVRCKACDDRVHGAAA